MKNTRLVGLVIAFVFIFKTFVFASSWGDTYGFSAKNISMGNAVTSTVNDWTSVYHNIAGLGRTPPSTSEANKLTDEIYSGYLQTQPNFYINIQRYDSSTDEALPTNGADDLDYGIVMLGIVVDLNHIYEMPSLISTARLGIALGVNSDMSIMNINDVDPRTHNFLRYGNESRQTKIMFGFGLGFLEDSVGVGFGINMAFGGDGKVLLKDVAVSTSEQTPEGQSTMTLKADHSYLFGIYADYDRYNFGFAYREESKLEIDPFSTVAVTEAGSIEMQLELAILDYYQPTMYIVGGSFQIQEGLLVSLDLEYQNWSGYQVASSKDKNYGSVLPSLNDIMVPKIGASWKIKENLVLLGGYYYQPTFVPDSAMSGIVNFLDTNKHVFSIGTSYHLNKLAGFKGPVELSAGYQLQMLEERSVTKTNPTPENPNYSFGGICHTVVFGFDLKL